MNDTIDAVLYLQPKDIFSSCTYSYYRTATLLKGLWFGFTSDGTDLTVSCYTNDSVAAARPPIDYVYIYSNGTLVPKHVSNNTVIVTEPELDTEFTCEGSNYLGNTTANKTFEPDSK